MTQPNVSSDRTDIAPHDAACLTQREAAQQLHVSVSYLRNSDCPKLLLPSGRGKRPLVRYLRADLERWTASRRVARYVPKAAAEELVR